MKKTLILLVITLAAVSCSYDDMRLQPPVELGAVPETILVSSYGGDVQIPFYANVSGTISLLDEAPWATLDMTSFTADGSLQVGVSANSGIHNSPTNNPYMMLGYVKGYPLNSLWGFHYAGVWHNEEEVARNEVTHAYAGQTASRSLRP